MYSLVENKKEVSYKERKSIAQGITILEITGEPNKKDFETKEEALKAFSKKKTTVETANGGAGMYFIVTEYTLENEDGEIEEITPMKIIVTDNETNEEFIFNNYEDAEEKNDGLADSFIG